jgi:predicted HAD superfamily Cof-like phosphohydrolase
MSKLQTQVAAFHRLFKSPIAPRPTIIEPARVALRASFVVEETFELLEALYGSLPEWAMCQEIVKNALKQRQPRVDLPKAVDALGDIDFFVEGTRLEFGVEGGSIADEIFRANMAKVGGEIRADGKQMKPKQWTPPDIEGVLRKQGAGELSCLEEKLREDQ